MYIFEYFLFSLFLRFFFIYFILFVYLFINFFFSYIRVRKLQAFERNFENLSFQLQTKDYTKELTESDKLKIRNKISFIKIARMITV